MTKIRLQNSPFLRQKSEKRGLTRGREMGERGEEGVAQPGEKGNGERGRATPSSPRSPTSRLRVKTRSKTLFSVFRRRKGPFRSLD